jgi:hypothetical protein
MMFKGMLVTEMTSQHAHDGRGILFRTANIFSAVKGMAPNAA